MWWKTVEDYLIPTYPNTRIIIFFVARVHQQSFLIKAVSFKHQPLTNNKLTFFLICMYIMNQTVHDLRTDVYLERYIIIHNFVMIYVTLLIIT